VKGSVVKGGKAVPIVGKKWEAGTLFERDEVSKRRKGTTR